jgi:hypothetical protein
MQTYYSLPFDVILIIAYDSPTVWYGLVQADPILGRYSLTVQKNAQDHFTTAKKEDSDRWVDKTKMVWSLPNGAVHRNGDQPAVVYDTGKLIWYRFGVIHRDGDKPAKIYGNGECKWYRFGLLHRDGDKPAFVDDEVKIWCRYGVRHRSGDQPAFVSVNELEWWVNGKRHRDNDQPAIIDEDSKWWYINGEVSRKYGRPSIEYDDGNKKWTRNGMYYHEEKPHTYVNGRPTWYSLNYRILFRIMNVSAEVKALLMQTESKIKYNNANLVIKWIL